MSEDSRLTKKAIKQKGCAWEIPKPIELTLEDRQFLEKLAEMIVKRGLSTPAVFLLESFKPFNFIGQQVAVFLDPLVKLFVKLEDYPRVVKLLEDRESLEYLLVYIEEKEAIKLKEKQDAPREGKDKEHPGD